VSRLKHFNWPGWSSLAFVLLLWELGGRAVTEYRLFLPSIIEVMGAGVQLLFSGDVARHFLVTLERFLTGYLIAAALGASLGVALGYFRLLHDLLGTVVELLRPMPSVAIIPVAILMLGIGDAMIVAVTVYASVWPHVRAQPAPHLVADHSPRGLALYRHGIADRFIDCADLGHDR
jgi:NitT/TauT family transport system permease protein